MVLAFLKIAVKLRQKTKIPLKKQCFWLEKNPKMSPKTGPKSQKKHFRATPHQRVEKKHVANPKNESKKLKTRGFFTFFWPRFGGRVYEQVFSVLFFTVFCEGERHDLSKTGGFFKKKPPPQVNLNLSWLMPSGWSRPLHLRCGRNFVELFHHGNRPLNPVYSWENYSNHL